jgi:hypothetical protein
MTRRRFVALLGSALATAAIARRDLPRPRPATIWIGHC